MLPVWGVLRVLHKKSRVPTRLQIPPPPHRLLPKVTSTSLLYVSLLLVSIISVEMLLTIKQPAHHGYKSFHDYTPPTPPSTSRFSPAVASTGPSFPPIPATNKSLPPLPASKPVAQQMSTPHRGLPPPAAMTLSQPGQQPPPLGQPPLSQPMGQLARRRRIDEKLAPC
jgi:hypothetical protein